jgi:hypothetical protein
MDELVACFTQYQESILGQVIIIRCIHMMYIEVGNTFVPNAAILAGHIPVGTDKPAEQLPSRSSSKSGTVFCGFYLHITLSILWSWIFQIFFYIFLKTWNFNDSNLDNILGTVPKISHEPMPIWH